MSKLNNPTYTFPLLNIFAEGVKKARQRLRKIRRDLP